MNYPEFPDSWKGKKYDIKMDGMVAYCNYHRLFDYYNNRYCKIICMDTIGRKKI